MHLKIFPCISLLCKLVPVQYWEYKYGLLPIGRRGLNQIIAVNAKYSLPLNLCISSKLITMAHFVLTLTLTKVSVSVRVSSSGATKHLGFRVKHCHCVTYIWETRNSRILLHIVFTFCGCFVFSENNSLVVKRPNGYCLFLTVPNIFLEC